MRPQGRTDKRRDIEGEGLKKHPVSGAGLCNFGIGKVKVKSLSHVRLLATPWTVAYQAPLSMGFSRQEYWSGLPFPSSGDLPDPGIKPRCPALQADALTSEPISGAEKIRCGLHLICFFPHIYLYVSMYLDIYHWVERVGHDLETKPPSHIPVYLSIYLSIYHYNDFVSWKESNDKTRGHVKKQRHHKGTSSQNCGFSSSHVWI